jgi:hypothetical protein
LKIAAKAFVVGLFEGEPTRTESGEMNLLTSRAMTAKDPFAKKKICSEILKNVLI